MATATMGSLSPFVTRFGYDSSCGDHSIVLSKEATSGPFPKIEIRYEEMMEGQQSFLYYDFMWWWNCHKPSLDEIKQILEAANVPAYIQRVHALDLILECVDHILMEARLEESVTGVRPRLPSLSAYIFSHQQDLTGFDHMISSSEDEDFEDALNASNLMMRDRRIRTTKINQRRRSCWLKKKTIKAKKLSAKMILMKIKKVSTKMCSRS